MTARLLGAPVALYPSVDGQGFAHDLLRDRIVEVTDEETAVLQQLSHFASSEELQARLGAAYWEHDDLHGVVDRLKAKNLVLSEHEVRNLLKSPSGFDREPHASQSPTQTAPALIVGIPSARSGRTLTRLLDSVAQNATGGARSVRTLLMEDRIDSGATPVAPPALHLATYPVAAARELTEKIADEVARDGSDHAAIEFGLLGSAPNRGALRVPTYGATRNRLLLLTHGSHLLMADDDTLFDPLIRKGRANVTDLLAMSYRREPFSTSIFESDRELSTAIERVERNIVEEHQKWLGRPIAALDPVMRGSLRVGELTRPMLYKVTKPNASIQITVPGVAGDPGTSSAALALFLDGNDRVELVGTRHSYEQKKFSRSTLRMTDVATLSPARWLMTTHLGVDNTRLLPPFSPEYRNEDGAWVTLLQGLIPEAHSLHLPFAISHARIRTAHEVGFDSFRFRINDLLALLSSAHAQAMVVRSRRQAMTSFGRFLMDLAEADYAELKPYLTSRIGQSLCAHLSRVHSLTWRYGEQPDYVLLDIQHYLHALQTEVERDDLWIPWEFRSASDGSTGERKLRTYLGSFGRFCSLWPGVVASEAARRARKALFTI